MENKEMINFYIQTGLLQPSDMFLYTEGGYSFIQLQKKAYDKEAEIMSVVAEKQKYYDKREISKEHIESLKSYKIQPAPQDLHFFLEDTANYYKLILKEAIPHIEKLVNILYSQGARQGQYTQEVNNYLHRLKSESYGAK